MSSQSPPPTPPKNVSRIYPIAPDLRPLLDHKTFVLHEIDLGDKEATEFRNLVRRCSIAGLVRKEGRVESDGKDRYRYEWVEGAREHIREYLEDLDTLPCGCRKHIPDSRDDPEGIISCKHCGEEYDEQRFKELVLGDGD